MCSSNIFCNLFMCIQQLPIMISLHQIPLDHVWDMKKMKNDIWKNIFHDHVLDKIINLATQKCKRSWIFTKIKWNYLLAIFDIFLKMYHRTDKPYTNTTQISSRAPLTWPICKNLTIYHWQLNLKKNFEIELSIRQFKFRIRKMYLPMWW